MTTSETTYTEELAKLQRRQAVLDSLSQLTEQRDRLIREMYCRMSYEVLLKVCEVIRRSAPWRLWQHAEQPQGFPWYKKSGPPLEPGGEPEPWPEPACPILAYWELDRNNVDTKRLHFITDAVGELYYVPANGKLTKPPETEEGLLELLRGSSQKLAGRRSGFAW